MRVDVRGNNRVTDCCYFPGKSVTTASDKHQINFRVLLLPFMLSVKTGLSMRKMTWGVIKCQKIPDNPNNSLKT